MAARSEPLSAAIQVTFFGAGTHFRQDHPELVSIMVQHRLSSCSAGGVAQFAVAGQDVRRVETTAMNSVGNGPPIAGSVQYFGSRRLRSM